MKIKMILKKLFKIVSEATDDHDIRESNLNVLNKNKVPFVDKKTANYCNESMFLVPVTTNEIIQHISSLKNNSAPGVDEITTIMIKSCHLYTVEPLKHIINLIFQSGEIPLQFKTSLISPIHGNKCEISNYRPISLINNFGNIFEICLKTRLTHLLKRHNIINDMQFGVRGRMGTSDACMR